MSKILSLIVVLITLSISQSVWSASYPNEINRGDFGPFQRSLNNKDHGHLIKEDVTGSAPTKLIEVFEVRPGDCFWQKSGWNDCNKDRERSELGEVKKETGSGSKYWYEWNIYFPENYADISPTATILGQFHQEKSYVIWLFQYRNGSYHLKERVFGGKNKTKHKLIGKGDLRGKWHKIEVQASWSNNDDGFFRVWVNGKQKVDYTGQTMTAEKVYFKYGIYRSFLSKYKKDNGVDKVPTQKVYYSNVKRGYTRSSLTP
jgi:hypothetical protein